MNILKERDITGIESDSFNENMQVVKNPEAGDSEENEWDREGDHIESEDILPDEEEDDY